MADSKINVGNVELVAVNDGFPLRSPLMPFPDTTIEQWREFPELMVSPDEVRSRYGTLAVRSQGKLIIIDTGLQAPDGILMEDLAQKGIDRDAVDLVVFTHLHPDHVGWNLTREGDTYRQPSQTLDTGCLGPIGISLRGEQGYRRSRTYCTRSCLWRAWASWS